MSSRVEVCDDFIAAKQIEAATAAWPASDWPGWLVYDTALEKKRTCRDWATMPDPLRAILCEVAMFVPRPSGMVPDMTLWGAGMCEMREGDFLSLHLDHDRHPHLSLTRHLNAIVFLGDCEGGELELWDAGRTAPTVRVSAVAGRLVTFTTTETSYHAVAPVRGKAVRRGLSLNFYGWPQRTVEEARRPRAQFVAAAGEPPDLERDRLRAERAQ